MDTCTCVCVLESSVFECASLNSILSQKMGVVILCIFLFPQQISSPELMHFSCLRHVYEQERKKEGKKGNNGDLVCVCVCACVGNSESTQGRWEQKERWPQKEGAS